VRLTGRMERPTLVFVPGFMQRGDAWAPVAQRLAERYPSVLLEQADDVPPPSAAVVGYSMGGRLALHAALAEPGRWHALALVGVSAGVEDPTARRAADEELAAWMERSPIEDIVERWERQPVFATQPPELVAAQRAGRLSHEPKRLAALLRNAGQGVMPPVWKRLPSLELPVLCIAGALDETYVAAGRRMASLLPRGTLRTIAGTGHAPQLEAPDAVAAELGRFLDECL
jgi:2-succinyl-6-hydroxy-2,4-cyclohexadiene-1-carboxylate synthase